MSILKQKIPGHLSCDPDLLKRFKALEAKQNKDLALSAKRKRGYMTSMSGMEKVDRLHIPTYRMDLTFLGNYDITFTSPDLQALRKRILRRYHIKLNYLAIKARGDKGGKLHYHIIYWCSTPSGKPIYELKRAWINKYWLSNAWHDITGAKITYIQTVKGELSKKRISNYLIGQYFSGQNDYERMSYSTGWLFRGAKTLWRTYFSPHYYEDKAGTLDSWTYLLAHQTDLAVIPNG